MELKPYLDLVQTCFPQLQIESVVPILDGWDNFVLEVNSDYIFRFTRRPEVQEHLKKEARLLPELNKHLSLQVPNPQYIQLDDSPYIMGYRKIPGTSLKKTHILPRNREKIAESLGTLLKELQSFPIMKTQGLGVPLGNGAIWRQEYADLYKRIQRELYPHLNNWEKSDITYHFKEFLDNPENFIFKPCLSHRDLGSDHILYDEKTEELTGIVDWGDSCIGDPAFDLTGLIHDYGEEFTDNVRIHAGLPLEALKRAEFYVKVIPFYQALYGIDIQDDIHIGNGLEKIRQTFTSHGIKNVKIQTIGYGGKKPENFFQEIEDYAPDLIVDVRENPYSAYLGSYTKKYLEKRLPYYVWIKELGNKSRSLPPTLVDEEAGLMKLISMMRDGMTVLLLCAEKDEDNCHRKYVKEKIMEKLE